MISVQAYCGLSAALILYALFANNPLGLSIVSILMVLTVALAIYMYKGK